MSLRQLGSLAAVGLLVPGLAAAAELGRLTLQSGVGEPLRAEIEIQSVRPGEAQSLTARIPPAEVFWRANLEPSPALDRVRVAVERRPGNRYVVTLRTGEPFDEPFVQLLVELATGAGNVVREYPFLLDEPRGRGARAVTAPALPEVEPPAERVPAPVRPPPAVPRPEGYAVRPGDTLAAIAQGLRLPGATLDQAMVAIYQANEQAFEGGNLNRLRAGQTLAIPTDDATQAIAPEEAQRLVLAHRAAYDEYRRQLAGNAPVRAGPDAERRADAPVASPAAPKSERDRLRVSGADAPKAGARAAGAQRALAEAQERIGLLEKNLDDVRMLLVMKDQQLARMARQAEVANGASTRAGDAAASDAAQYEPDTHSVLSRFLGYYGGWVVLGFVVGFASWILMPVKTVRLWWKKRRRRERDLRRHARGVRRAARDAGLLSTSS